MPIYGICFGAQSIAAALGGSVGDGAASRRSAGTTTSTATSEVDPAGPWMQWHSDAVTMPPDAVELARSPLCTQAYRIGRTFATQFHPEVNEAMVTRWGIDGADTLASAGHLDRRAARRDRRATCSTVAPNAERLVDWFLEHVAGGSSAPISREGREA